MKNFKFLKYIIVFSIMVLFFSTSDLSAKWISLGFEDTWNDGLFKGYKGGIVSFCLDNIKRPHLICNINDGVKKVDYYIYFDGLNWKGLESEEPTELTMIPNNFLSNVVMKLDSKNFPHLLYYERPDDNKNFRILNYIFWDGTGWSQKSEVIRTDHDIDSLSLESAGFNFAIDKSDRPHVIYLLNTAPKMQDYSYICHRYLDNGEWKTLNDGDQVPGVFKEITDITGKHSNDWIFAKRNIKLDSKGYPHIGCMLYYGPLDEDPSTCIYTFYDGEKWTGIDDSQKETGLPDSYITNEGDYPKINFNFHIDKDDNVHFIYSASINDERQVVYRKWDGINWSGLKANEEYSNIDLDFYYLYYFSNLSDTGTPSILTLSNPILRYNYWDGSSWKSFGGKDKIFEIVPIGFINSDIRGFEPEENNKSEIAGKFYIKDSQGNYIFHISVLKWEDETVPTVELYTNDLDHPTSEPNVRIYGRLNNPFDHDTNINLIVAMMNPQGDILFFPNWTKDYSSIPLTLPAGYALPWSELLNFAIPSDSPPVKTSGTYYFGILLNKPGTSEYYSYDVKKFNVVE
jgi:hypothetical protein